MGEIADALRRDREKPRTPTEPERRKREVPRLSELQSQNADREPAGQPAPSSRSSEAAPEAARIAPAKIGAADLGPHRPARVSVLEPSHPASHRFRHLATRVQRVLMVSKIQTLVLTSPQMGDGKTTTVCNLAVQLSRLDRSRRIALVDCDLRRPAISAALGVKPRATLQEVLRGSAPLDGARVPTQVGGLDLYLNRGAAPDLEDLLSSDRLQKMIERLERSYSVVLLDAPPVLVAGDVTAILNVAPACLLVAQAGVTHTGSISEALAQLPREKLIGTCLNAVRNAESPAYGYEREEAVVAGADGLAAEEG